MITEVEHYFTLGCGRCERFATADCSTRRWIDGLTALRRICLAAGLAETAKWGHPAMCMQGATSQSSARIARASGSAS